MRLVQCDLVVAGIDLGDDCAGVDMLVVGDGNIRDVTRHLGRDGEAAGIDEGVVRRLVGMEIDEPDEIAGDSKNNQRKNNEKRRDRMTPDD